MDFAQWFASPAFKWIILPILIFLARLVDVSLGTIRLIFVSRGFKFLAPIMGFFESMIWLLAIGQIMQNLTNPICYIAYAGGFAMGNFLGILLEQKLSLGIVIVRVVFRKDIDDVMKYLKSKDYGFTVINAKGTRGKVKMIFSIIRRAEIQDFVKAVQKFNPGAFYSVEDVRFVNEGIFRPRKKFLLDQTWQMHRK